MSERSPAVAAVCFIAICAALFCPAMARGQEDAAAPIPPLEAPPPPPPPSYLPFPKGVACALDKVNNRIGAAQQIARERQVQGRVLWIDATANLEAMNSAEKIKAVVAKARAAGFNTIVLDVKPIAGQTLHQSQIAPKMMLWMTAAMPRSFDPLAVLVEAGHEAGLQIIANLNVFSEGHRLFGRGPGFERPEWQSVLCEPQLVLAGANGAKMPLILKGSAQPIPPRSIGIYFALGDAAPSPQAAIAVVDGARRVVALTDGATAALQPPGVPRGGTALVGEGEAAAFLRGAVAVGAALPYGTSTVYVLSGQSAPGIPLWVNPHNPQVQQRILDIIAEVVTNYAVDGVIFDDRMRYAGINADFSEDTRRAFEAYVGKPLTWPDDVLRFEASYPTMSSRRVLAGPFYDTWVLWRAMTIRNWLARAVNTVKAIRPTATVSVYVGSWYGEYAALGSNWAADDFQAGFRFLTDSFRKTGYAGLLDWIATGCYYSVPTIAEANAQGLSPGYTIEAAGQLSNRCADSETWVYAGISLDKFDGNPEGLGRALQAAAASTQGVMVFDLSHKIEQFWPVFQQAFQQPVPAPHAVPGLLAEVRMLRAERRAAGEADPPVIIQAGAPGTGL